MVLLVVQLVEGSGVAPFVLDAVDAILGSRRRVDLPHQTIGCIVLECLVRRAVPVALEVLRVPVRFLVRCEEESA